MPQIPQNDAVMATHIDPMICFGIAESDLPTFFAWLHTSLWCPHVIDMEFHGYTAYGDSVVRIATDLPPTQVTTMMTTCETHGCKIYRYIHK